MAKRQHNHLIDVKTDEEIVTVTIGSDGGIPGGFAKLFNRVVDSEAWARLSDAARAAYLPLVRFADHRNQFRVQLGRAAMMKYTGLSQSSIKRAIKDLIAQKLIVLIEQGGVSASGENESNVYQLLVPAESAAARARAAQGHVHGTPTPSPAVHPPGVPVRTPTRTVIEPPVSPPANPPAARDRTPAGGHAAQARGFTAGPQLRTVDKEISKTASTPRLPADVPSSLADRAAVLLEQQGVEASVARQLAEAFSHERIVDVVATMQWRQARGKCDNPGGFIRDALVKQWQTPRAVLDARAKAEARLKAEEGDRQARAAAARQEAQVGQEESQIDHLIASLDEEELALLAQSVLAKYQGNAAVTSVLTRKPPRESRLMKMEIAAMLRVQG